MASARRLFLYALGGGLGHLQRALALARRALQKGHHARLLTNSPWAARVRASPLFPADLDLIALDPALGRAEVIAATTTLLAQSAFDALVVDTFPRGLAGELGPILPALGVPKILVHRDMNPAYAARAEVVEATRLYDLLLLPGERGPLSSLGRAELTEPWLLLDAHELLPPAEARTALGLAPGDERPAIVVMGTGTPAEARSAAALTDALAARVAERAWLFLCTLEDTDTTTAQRLAVWPLLRLLPGVDLLIGAAGYNTVYEARMTGTPLWAFAQKRLYDRQAERLSACERAPSPREIEEHLAHTARAPRPAPTYTSGAVRALALIEALMAARDRA